jgi:CheY-like chemotaxis protein
MSSPAKGERHHGATSARCAARRIRGKRIFYVVDDALLRRVANRFLGSAGAICVLARKHDEAVTLAGGDPERALAILDFQMLDDDIGHLVKRLEATRAALSMIGTSGAGCRGEFAERDVTQSLEEPWHLEYLGRAVIR